MGREKRFGEKMKNKERKELAVCGWAAVKALCEKNSDKVQRLYFTKERAKELGAMCKMMAANKKPYNMVEDEAELEKLSGTPHHQGAVAMILLPRIERLTSDVVDEWIERKEDVAILDRVGNANNLGAIVRSAAFFGIKNIVIPLDEAQTSITTSSYRVAQGGMERVRFFSVKSISYLLKDLKGRMVRIGTALDATMRVDKIADIRANKGVALILGNEENGISDEVKKNCDERVIIPFVDMDKGGESPVESLNVAQAASIIFYEASKRGVKEK